MDAIWRSSRAHRVGVVWGVRSRVFSTQALLQWEMKLKLYKDHEGHMLANIWLGFYIVWLALQGLAFRFIDSSNPAGSESL